MNKINTQEEYDRLLENLGEDKLKNRFEKILDIRKFEIELYWKRATYFWAFIGVAFTTYGLTIDKPGAMKFRFLTICIGLLFSVAFYMVNKASKFWQENWEKHTDFSESKVIGALYKVTSPVSPKKYIWNPKSEYSASVSRINIYISFVLVVIWTFLLIGFCVQNLKFSFSVTSYSFYYFTFILLFTLYSCYFLLFKTTTDLWQSESKFIIR